MKELIEKLEEVRKLLSKTKSFTLDNRNYELLNVEYYDEISNYLWEVIKALSQIEVERKIDKAIKTFEDAKNKATSLRDIIYLDGVLAILDTIKNESQTK